MYSNVPEWLLNRYEFIKEEAYKLRKKQQYEDAIDLLRDFLPIVEQELGKEALYHEILTRIGLVVRVSGDYVTAKRDYIRPGLAYARRVGDNWLIGFNLAQLAIMAKDEKRIKKAMRYADQGWWNLSAVKDPSVEVLMNMAVCIDQQAWGFLDLGRPGQAEPIVKRNINKIKNCPELKDSLFSNYSMLARILCHLNKFEEAENYARLAYDYELSKGHVRGQLTPTVSLAWALFGQARKVEAREALAKAEHLMLQVAETEMRINKEVIEKLKRNW